MAARQMEEHKAERVEKLQRVKALGLHLNHNKRFAETEHKCCTCDRPLNPATELQPFLSKQVLPSHSLHATTLPPHLSPSLPHTSPPPPPPPQQPLSPACEPLELHDAAHTVHSPTRQQTLMHYTHIACTCMCPCARLVCVTAV